MHRLHRKLDTKNLVNRQNYRIFAKQSMWNNERARDNYKN
jgi:hypothetical protein